MSDTNRMAMAGLSLAGLFVAVYLALHRLGVIGTLACGADGGCSTVQSSSYATFLGVPVPFIGVAGYVVLFVVSMAALNGRWLEPRRMSLLLLVLSAGAFAFSVYLTALEAFVIHAWCRWCVVSALITTSIFLCSLPEVKRLRREVVP